MRSIDALHWPREICRHTTIAGRPRASEPLGLSVKAVAEPVCHGTQRPVFAAAGMYVGHLMPGVVALALDPSLPTSATLLAGTWVDLMCGLFISLGLDRVSIGARCSHCSLLTMRPQRRPVYVHAPGQYRPRSLAGGIGLVVDDLRPPLCGTRRENGHATQLDFFPSLAARLVRSRLRPR